jgi:phage terminase small subunit
MTKPKGSDGGKKLDMRKQKYVAGRLEGKSKKDSAMDAGYSPAMARNAAAKIESLDVRRSFQELARKAVPTEKILKRLAEGLDATWIHQDNKKGTVAEAYFRERREYLILAAKLGGYYIEKRDVAAEVRIDETELADRRQRVQAVLKTYVDHEVEKRLQAAAPGPKEGDATTR